MSYRVTTAQFEGPFDLLLHLVTQQKLDIGAISVNDVAKQYLTEMDRLNDLDLDVASDFLLVASTLLDIKASSLVPNDKTKADVDEDDEEFEGLSTDEIRDVLVERLLVYKKFKNAASSLNSRMEAESRMLPRTVGPDPEFNTLTPDYLENITLRGLGIIAADLASRRETFLLESEHIAASRIPLEQHVETVDRFITRQKETSFQQILAGDDSRENVVVSFLAILELVKRNSIEMSQPELFGDIHVKHIDGAAAYIAYSSDTVISEEDW